MARWSTRRKASYAFGVIAFFVLVIGGPAFFFFYNAPTCNDGKLNQGELGVDCSGPCPRICPSAYLPPQISWARADLIDRGTYNLAAYIKNPNLTGAVRRAPYVFTLYDREGHFIGERKGEMMIPPQKNLIAFERAVFTDKSEPFKITFEFTAPLAWEKATPQDTTLIVTNRNFSADAVGYTLEATIENHSLLPIEDLTVYGIIYDDKGNVTGFSKSALDRIDKSASEYVAFTWRKFGDRNVTSSEVIPVVPPRFVQ